MDKNQKTTDCMQNLVRNDSLTHGLIDTAVKRVLKAVPYTRIKHLFCIRV